MDSLLQLHMIVAEYFKDLSWKELPQSLNHDNGESDLKKHGIGFQWN